MPDEKKKVNGIGVWKATTAFLSGLVLAGVSGYFAYGDVMSDMKVIKEKVGRIETTQKELVSDVIEIKLTLARMEVQP